jgi:hypothetical protein
MSLISIGADWEYQLTANTVPPSPEIVSVPTTSWLTASPGPFGEGEASSVSVQAATTWTRTNGLWIRRFITVDGLREVVIKGRIEQALYLYWGGTYIGAFNPDNDGRTDIPEYRIIIPTFVATSGVHEIALLCLDDDSLSGTSYVSVEAEYMPPVFSLQPQAPIDETLEWLTDVSISHDGTEERLQVTLSPRQSFKMNFPAPPNKKRLAQNVLWGNLDEEFLMPIWTQPVVVGAIASGQTSLNIDTTYSEFRESGLALIWESFDNWQVLGVYSVSSGTIVFTADTRAFSNAWVLPLRTGFISNKVNKSLDGYKANFSFEINILDNEELTVSAPTQYKADDIYTDVSLLEGSTTNDDININLNVFDPGIGLVEFYGTWNNARMGRTHRILNEDLSSAWALREFLHRRAGRYRQFWQPSFENDLNVKNSGNIDAALSVDRDDYLKFAQERTHIAVEADGVWYFREILSAAIVDADTMSLTLDSALGIASSAVKRVSWLGIKRLDTDVVEIKHLTGGVSTCAFRIVEIEP